MRFSREFGFVVHDYDGISFLLVQVALVLYADCACACVYMGEDGTFHPSPAWFYLPAPL
jgi:hypothetical protein